MAERAPVAFGYYLRSLRERRGLSLEEVATLTKDYPEPVSKAYLSRVEHGRNTVSFPRMIALARVYKVPLEVLAERLELDLELDKRGGPDTRSMKFEELHWAGAKAYFQGFIWDAYAYSRDAVPLASGSPLLPTIDSATEQHLNSTMNCAGIVANLGKFHLSLHELEAVRAVNGLPPNRAILLNQRLASRYVQVGDFSRAREFATLAITGAERSGNLQALGYAYSARAYIALEQKQYSEARQFFEKAHRAFSEANRPQVACYMLLELAHCYLDTQDIEKAKKYLLAGERLAQRSNERHAVARAMLMHGDIEQEQGHHERAARWWREASDTWRQTGNRIGRFRTDCRLFRQAVAVGNEVLAQALQRRLTSSCCPTRVTECPWSAAGDESTMRGGS